MIFLEPKVKKTKELAIEETSIERNLKGRLQKERRNRHKSLGATASDALTWMIRAQVPGQASEEVLVAERRSLESLHTGS